MHEQHTQAMAERVYLLHEQVANNVASIRTSMNFTGTEALTSDVSKLSTLTMLAVQARSKRMMHHYASDMRFTAG
ncbi:hypothetical protein ACOSQ2_003761 [Xanthoceras sorbifolium]